MLFLCLTHAPTRADTYTAHTHAHAHMHHIERTRYEKKKKSLPLPPRHSPVFRPFFAHIPMVDRFAIISSIIYFSCCFRLSFLRGFGRI